MSKDLFSYTPMDAGAPSPYQIMQGYPFDEQTGLPKITKRPRLIDLSAAAKKTEKFKLKSLLTKPMWGVGDINLLSPNVSSIYDPRANELFARNALTGRHELGHWLQRREAITAPLKSKIRLRINLLQLKQHNPDVYNQIVNTKSSRTLLYELLSHVRAAEGKGAGANLLRASTSKDWISPAADSLRTKSPALASAIEHLQRNYELAGGKPKGGKIINILRNLKKVRLK